MKRLLFCLLGLLGSIVLLHAQNEVPADTVTLTPPSDAPILPSTVKSYGGFLLDMGLMNLNMLHPCFLLTTDSGTLPPPYR